MRTHIWRPGAVALALFVSGACASTAAAAAGPDLKVAKVATPADSSYPGGKLAVSLTVANAGTRRAKGSRAGVLLSRDRKRDTRDVQLGSVAIHPLKGHGKARVNGSLTVSRLTAPGAYHVMACADVKRKVRERSERNNCRATKKVIVIAAAGALPPASSGAAPLEAAIIPGPASPGPAPATPAVDLQPFVPSPLDVTPSLDAARSVSKLVTTGGDTLATTGADGTKYELKLPPNAVVDPITITMTPLAALPGIPFSGGLGGGVQLGPEGTQFVRAATLTITPPAPVPLAERATFSYAGAGKDFHLEPSSYGPDKIEFELLHFSAYGWGKATAEDRATQTERVPSDREAWARQNLARALQEAEIARENGDEPNSDRWIAAAGVAMFVWGNEGVRAALTEATTNDEAFSSAAREYLSWERQRQLLGAGMDGLAAELAALFHDAWNYAAAQAAARCYANKDPYQYLRILVIERERQLLGASDEDGTNTLLDRLDHCFRFELQIHHSFRYQSDAHDGSWDGGTDVGDTKFVIRPFANGLADAFPIVGDTTLTSATVHIIQPKQSWVWNGQTELIADGEPKLQYLDIDFGEPADDGTLPEPKVTAGIDWAEVMENGTFTDCNGECASIDLPSAINSLALGSLYVDVHPMTEVRDWTIESGAGNEVFATKDRTRSLHSNNTDGTGFEDIELRLLHKPLP